MLTFGALLVSGALLAFGVLLLVFRRPAPPRWTTRSGVGELVSVAFVTLLTFGMGYLVAGVIGVYQRGPDLIDLSLSVVVLAGAVILWRRLYVRRRLQAYAAAGRANLATQPGSALKLGTPAARPEPAAEPADLHAA